MADMNTKIDNAMEIYVLGKEKYVNAILPKKYRSQTPKVLGETKMEYQTTISTDGLCKYVSSDKLNGFQFIVKYSREDSEIVDSRGNVVEIENKLVYVKEELERIIEAIDKVDKPLPIPEEILNVVTD